MNKSDSENSCGTSAENVFQKLGHGTWSGWGNSSCYCSESWSWYTEHHGHENRGESWDSEVSSFNVFQGSVHVKHKLTIGSLNGSLNKRLSWSSFSSGWEMIGNNSLFLLNLINLKSNLLLYIFRLNRDLLSSSHVDSFLEPIIDNWLRCGDSTEILDISGLGLHVQAFEVVVLAGVLVGHHIYSCGLI